MISYLQGKPILDKDGLIIVANGVGYGVHVTEKFRSLAANQPSIELFVYTHVREDALELFGFNDRNQRDMFVLLLSVSGVGPKTALNILNFEANEIIQAVQMGDVSLFSAVPRVGKKLAQKIIIELRSKLGSLKELDLAPLSAQKQTVFDALTGLGFEERSIHQVLQNVPVDDMPLPEAIKTAMKELSSKTL